MSSRHIKNLTQDLDVETARAMALLEYHRKKGTDLSGISELVPFLFEIHGLARKKNFNGQLTLHIANGEIGKVHSTEVKRGRDIRASWTVEVRQTTGKEEE